MKWPDFKLPPINLCSVPKQQIDYDYDADLACTEYLIAYHAENFKKEFLRREMLLKAKRDAQFINFCITGKYE